MTTLYVRDVPEDVAATLKQRAAMEGQSVSAYVNAQLAIIASRPTNAEIVERLRRRPRPADLDPEQIVDVLAQSRR